MLATISTTFVALSTFAILVSAKPGLSLALNGPKQAKGVGELIITATLINTGDVELKLLNDPRTVLNSFETDTFSITNAAGKSPVFQGAFVKYSPETILAEKKNSSFTALAPGARIEIKHDLSKAYNFTSAGIDNYDIVAANAFQYLDDGKLSTIQATTAYTSGVKLEGMLAVSRPSGDQHPPFNNCSASQQEQIASAAAAAENYLNGTREYLYRVFNHTTSAAPSRFASWFGNFTQLNHKKVLTNFIQLGARPLSAYTYDCVCDSYGADVFAFVHATDLDTLSVCGLFWDAPLTGLDSKAGTLIQAASHFATTAATRDLASGKTASLKLAIDNPAEATVNADSYEYFAEHDDLLSSFLIWNHPMWNILNME
ncbi:Peptidyl-Lys metalloendopeptidase [Mycena indigotica]|uniref:Peptidyl-Lys metalloendopeptidase n=1 Tax=Mycena indigotica TaxID=2126181 RepID=A0A8H6T6F5_9AGAR|nr:Peptidyl-Lys metalloendopeptidase [Mycena indigotica]KAF7311760.1 Peptidyl-Lys metalloendopeptidase [Mycena indigotica]